MTKNESGTVPCISLLALASRFERKADKAGLVALKAKTIRERTRLKAAQRALEWCADELREKVRKANATGESRRTRRTLDPIVGSQEDGE